MRLCNLFIGNLSVNMYQHAKVRSCVFYVVCAMQQYRAVISVRGPCRRIVRGSRKTEESDLDSSVWSSFLYGRLWRKQLKECGCEEKTLCVISGVIQWDCYSSCVKNPLPRKAQWRHCKDVVIVQICYLATTSVSRRWRRYLCVIITVILRVL
jgi:hypothetical protein